MHTGQQASKRWKLSKSTDRTMVHCQTIQREKKVAGLWRTKLLRREDNTRASDWTRHEVIDQRREPKGRLQWMIQKNTIDDRLTSCLNESAVCGDKTLIAASYRQIESYWTMPPPPPHARSENQSPKWMPSHRILLLLAFHRFIANISVLASLIQLMIAISDDTDFSKNFHFWVNRAGRN